MHIIAYTISWKTHKILFWIVWQQKKNQVSLYSMLQDLAGHLSILIWTIWDRACMLHFFAPATRRTNAVWLATHVSPSQASTILPIGNCVPCHQVHLCTLRLHPTRNIYRSTTQAHHSRRQAEIIEFQGHHISFPFDPFLQTPDAQVLALGELAYIDTCSSYVWEKQVFIHGSVWSTRVHCPPQREVHCLAMQRE